MKGRERQGLFKSTQEVLARLFDQRGRPLQISAKPVDKVTDLITYNDGNGKQVIIVPEKKSGSSS